MVKYPFTIHVLHVTLMLYISWDIIFTGAVTNAAVVPRPLFLDNAPPKSSLPTIQPFKRHMHLPKQLAGHQAASRIGLSDSSLISDGIPVVMKGRLSEVC